MPYGYGSGCRGKARRQQDRNRARTLVIMVIFEIVIALLLAGAVLALWAARLGVPYPALLALAGAALALIPGAPEIQLDPELALALFVAPALLDASFDASPRDLRANFVPVASLALIAVALTILTVAIVARQFFPDLGWAAAITLGAIVAPPDAAAATAVLRQIRPPHRLLVILEGESLFNDASALLVYRIAAAAAMTGAFSAWSVLPMLLLTCGGGIVAGWVLAHANLWLMRGLRDVPITVLAQFVATFAVWIIAEHLGLSAILAVVSFGMTAARYAPIRTGARHRFASYAVWEVAVFVLNVLAFVLIGLQLRGIIGRLARTDLSLYVSCAAAVCAAVILTRFAWVMFHNSVARLRVRLAATPPDPELTPTVASGLAISWSGMRGIVTLATALALPVGVLPVGTQSGAAGGGFPYRDLIVLCAFAVVVATLVVQGLTLRPLMRRLGLTDSGIVEREIRLARIETAGIAVRMLDTAPTPSLVALREQYEARQREIANASADDGRTEGAGGTSLRHEVVMAQRHALMDLRARQIIGDDAFHAMEEELDLLELSADPRLHAS
jgi:CPA1 family monovalent cation:H+ antiporter